LRQFSTPISKTSFRWVLVGWMFLVSAIAYLDRVNISIAGPSIAEEFHLTNVELGGVLSAHSCSATRSSKLLEAGWRIGWDRAGF